jgi:hypothetical protein
MNPPNNITNLSGKNRANILDAIFNPRGAQEKIVGDTNAPNGARGNHPNR